MSYNFPAGYITGGTFVPILSFGGSSTNLTYAAHTGEYSRIGNIVTFTLDIELSNKGISTGSASIAGLPFSAANTNIFAISADSLTFVGMVNARCAANAAIVIDQWATAGSRTQLADTAFGNSTFLQITGSYLV
jgi:hypothetical protein